MAEKRLTGRLVNKHDIAANWAKATTFVPMAGELIVYDIDADYAYERIKIGDGTRNVNALPFVDDALSATLIELINAVDDKVDAVSALVGDTPVSAQINTAIEAIPDGFSGSWNDLTDKPFYEESRILYEGYPEYAWGYAKLPLVLKAGTSYSVGWINGDTITSFDYVAAVNNYGDVSIERIDPDYMTGFEIQYIENEGLCYFYGHGSMFQEGMPETSEDGSYAYTSTIKLRIAYCSDDDAGVKTLDEKYIPDAIARVGHTHDDVYYTENEVDAIVKEINTSISKIVDGSSVIAEATHATSADSATHATSADMATKADSATAADSATKATKDGSDNVIADTYETKTDANAKLTSAKAYTDDELDRLVGDTAVATQISDAIATITPGSIGALDQDDYYGIVQKEGDVVSADSLEGLAIGATTFITATVEGTPDYAAGSVATITPVSVVNLHHGAEYDASAEAALSATLPELVYGGTLDWVTGVLTVTHAVRDLTAANWTASSNAANRYLLAMQTASLDACTHYPISAWIAYDNVIIRNSPNQVVVNCSSIATLDDWKAYLSEQSAAGTPLTVVYGLPEAQHYTIQLNPQELIALNGVNTVWSDCGDTRVTFNYTPLQDGTITAAKISSEFLPSIKNAILTPQMFGAIGDGVADDTQAIQDAIDAAATTSGTVYLPTGNYLVTSTITVKSGVDVLGTRSSRINPACDVVFYSKQRSRLSGFYVHILAEHSPVVNTVFLVDYSSKSDSAGTLNIRYDDIQITNSATESNDRYTVWDIHSADGVSDGTSTGVGFWGVTIRRCSAKNNIVMGYAARIYGYKTDWVSSILIDGCDTSAFKWHWFFMPSEELATSPDYSYHNSNCMITNCAGQWGQGSMGFVYAANANVLRLFNNMTWDWGVQNNTGNIHPYLFSRSFYQEGQVISDIKKANWHQFGIFEEDGSVASDFVGINWINRIFEERKLPSEPDVKTYFVGGLQNGDAYKVGAFCLWEGANYQSLPANIGSIRFILMDEYGRVNRVILTRTAAYVDYLSDKYHFAFNENYSKAYIVASGTNVPRNLFAISIPLAGGMMQRSASLNARAANVHSINVHNKWRDEVYFSVAPEGLITLPTTINPNNNIIYSPNGTAYQLTVDDSGVLTATAATETALYDIT